MSILLFYCSSCIEGYKDDWEFSSDVKNSTLESPAAEKIACVVSPDGSTATITWPVVYGAGGYEFSFYIVDDPDNPIVVGEENQIVDGCSVQRPLQADTKYKIVIKTLGNEKYNNKDAATASTKNFTTMVPTYATIPNGSDITQWFAANPIPADSTNTELAYELEADGNYTMSGIVNFGNQKVTFRGNKIKHPIVTMGTAGRISTSAGLKVKFINFDCNSIAGSSTDAALLLLSSTPNPAIKGTGDYYIITDPVVLQACNITGVQRHLVYDNKIKYCTVTLLIDNCIVKLNTTQAQPIIYFNQGFAKDFTVKNSTFWSTASVANNYFVQYNSSGRPDRAGLVTGSVNFLNSTFYKVCYTTQWCNYSALVGRSDVYWNMKENIFVNCGNGEVARRFLGGRTGLSTATFNLNTYWYNGAFPTGEKTYDTGTILQSDPMLKDPANGDFTVQGTDQLNARTGDPRWLPIE
jgi:hypothetical protein